MESRHPTGFIIEPSALREQLPTAVRAALDQASRTERKETLHALAECTDRFGFDHTVRALEVALAQARLAYSHIRILATQMAAGPQPPAAGPDLTGYDGLLP